MEQFFGFVAFVAFIGVVYWLASRRKRGTGGSFDRDGDHKRER